MTEIVSDTSAGSPHPSATERKKPEAREKATTVSNPSQLAPAGITKSADNKGGLDVDTVHTTSPLENLPRLLQQPVDTVLQGNPSNPSARVPKKKNAGATIQMAMHKQVVNHQFLHQPAQFMEYMAPFPLTAHSLSQLNLTDPISVQKCPDGKQQSVHLLTRQQGQFLEQFTKGKPWIPASQNLQQLQQLQQPPPEIPRTVSVLIPAELLMQHQQMQEQAALRHMQQVQQAQQQARQQQQPAAQKPLVLEEYDDEEAPQLIAEGTEQILNVESLNAEDVFQQERSNRRKKTAGPISEALLHDIDGHSIIETTEPSNSPHLEMEDFEKSSTSMKKMKTPPNSSSRSERLKKNQLTHVDGIYQSAKSSEIEAADWMQHDATETITSGSSFKRGKRKSNELQNLLQMDFGPKENSRRAKELIAEVVKTQEAEEQEKTAGRDESTKQLKSPPAKRRIVLGKNVEEPHTKMRKAESNAAHAAKLPVVHQPGAVVAIPAAATASAAAPTVSPRDKEAVTAPESSRRSVGHQQPSNECTISITLGTLRDLLAQHAHLRDNAVVPLKGPIDNSATSARKGATTTRLIAN